MLVGQEAGNYENVSDLAHKLKASVSSLHIDYLNESVGICENKDGSYGPERIAEAIGYISQVLNDVVVQLRADYELDLVKE